MMKDGDDLAENEFYNVLESGKNQIFTAIHYQYKRIKPHSLQLV